MSAADRDGEARRRELGEFLRSRRERTQPADVGLPGSSRRRTPGLRREEVAAVAGVSATWYTYLEQGREIHASDEVLDGIASALHFSGGERDYLHQLAATPTVSSGGAGAEGDELIETVSPEVAAVPGLLDTPAYVTGRGTDLLAWNVAVDELFPGLTGSREPGADTPNLALWVFFDEAARAILVDWTEVAQTVLARLRANTGRHPTDARLRLLTRRLRDESAEAAAWWPRYDIATSTAGTKQLRHPTRGPISLRHAAFTVSDAPEQVLVVYRYADELDGRIPTGRGSRGW